MKKSDLIFLLLIFSAVTSYSQKISVQEYINTYKDMAITKMIEYGIPASITLAQALLESNNGNSPLAVKANNHFGIKCHLDWDGKTFYKDDETKNECFRKYKTVEESFRDHSLYLTSNIRYKFLFELDISNYKSWAEGLKKAGYATNPKYPVLLINLIEENKLYEFDRQGTQLLAMKGSQNLKQEIKPVNVTPTQEFYVSIKNCRKIFLKNNVKYIIAKSGDTYKKLAQEFEMFTWQFHRYNDLSGNDELHDGQIVYLQPKRNRGNEEFYIARKGDTMYSISQNFGIKLKKLYKKNLMQKNEEISEGQKIWLKKKKTV